jgi:hypothetical protein
MSDKVNQLAKEMRERALLLDADPKLTAKDLEGKKLAVEKQRQTTRVNDLKKLYFNAGRWAGGARDITARTAFFKVSESKSYFRGNK